MQAGLETAEKSYERAVMLSTNDVDAIFNLASMTKVLTVVTALTLYEEGRLPLKSTLATYYPQFASMQVGVIDVEGSRSAFDEGSAGR